MRIRIVSGSYRFVVVSLVVLSVASIAARVSCASVEVPLERLTESSLKSQEEVLTALLAESKDDPYLMRELGRVVYRRGKESVALELWKRASELDDRLPGPDVELVFIDLASGNLPAAEERLQRLQVDSTNDPHVMIAAGELALLKNDREGANQWLTKALDTAPHFPSANLTMGHFMEVTGDFPAAEYLFRKVTELQPDRAPGWLRLGTLMFRQDKMEDALKAFQEAEKCKGKQPSAHTRMGEAYYRRGDRFAAYMYFRAAAKRDAADPFPRLRIGQILESVGRRSEAVRELEGLVAETEYPEALKVLGEIRLVEKEYQQAIDYYRRALKVDPDDLIACNNLAMLLVQTSGSKDEALQLIERAVRLNERNLAAINGTHGCVLWYAGRMADAENLLAQAVNTLPGQSWIRYCYGKLLQEKGQTDAAVLHLRACLFLDDKFDRKSEVIKLISELRPGGTTTN